MEMYEKFSIPQSDYYELKSKNSRWTVHEYAYWVAKFKSGYPAEGYGLFNPTLLEENGKYYILWSHYDTCD